MQVMSSRYEPSSSRQRTSANAMSSATPSDAFICRCTTSHAYGRAGGEPEGASRASVTT